MQNRNREQNSDLLCQEESRLLKQGSKNVKSGKVRSFNYQEIVSTVANAWMECHNAPVYTMSASHHSNESDFDVIQSEGVNNKESEALGELVNPESVDLVNPESVESLIINWAEYGYFSFFLFIFCADMG